MGRNKFAFICGEGNIELFLIMLVFYFVYALFLYIIADINSWFHLESHMISLVLPFTVTRYKTSIQCCRLTLPAMKSGLSRSGVVCWGILHRMVLEQELQHSSLLFGSRRLQSLIAGKKSRVCLSSTSGTFNSSFKRFYSEHVIFGLLGGFGTWEGVL